MNKIITNLNGDWILESDYLENLISVKVPGSVYNDLLENQIVSDPFDQDNEYNVREIMRNDFSYYRNFLVSLDNYRNFLVCLGIDTISSIYINDKLVSNTNNMHRTYRIDITDYLINGENKIRIDLKSPINYIETKKKNCTYELFQASDAIQGYPHIRKASSMYGWDWGPQLPDAGIWRDIFIESFEDASIEEVKITQKHKNSIVELDVKTYITVINENKKYVITTTLFDENNKEIITQSKNNFEESLKIKVNNPKLWYPIGYGLQLLYKIKVKLLADNKVIDETVIRFGFRDIKVIRKPDQYGESFTVNVNGINIFAKGANYIPEDSLLPRTNYDLTKDLLLSAIEANHNMIRIWGGGIYPPDYFYDICDELGLLVWQDLMFACSAYDMNDLEWVETTKAEIKDNLIRIRNHPSIALICGNNENETAIECWNVEEKELASEFYVNQYIEMIEPLVEEHFPNITYWRSSPASKELFKDTNSDNYGDMHYWGVWHANEPITYYRKIYPRFMSEFGLQSFPTLKTVKTFAREKDLNIFSYIMEQHQKNKTSNSKILNYVGKMFKYPKDFDSLLYVSQIIQAEGIRYGVEHWRRNYGRCMGILYWQLNDCSPVASWSSIDYFHRWKVLHYHSKKFYQPILVSIEEENSIAKIYVTNDTLSTVNGTLSWELLDFKGNILKKGSKKVKLNKQSAKKYFDLDFKLNNITSMDKVLNAYLKIDSSIISWNQVSFVPDKYLFLQKPTFETNLSKTKTGYILVLKTDIYAKYVEISFKNLDIRFSDNYFNLLPNKEIKIIIKTKETLDINNLEIRSLYDTY